MNGNDLHEMSETYRKKRKAVYEEATRPSLNNPAKHRENKEKLKKKIEDLCAGADLSKYHGKDKETATAIWHHLWTKIKFAGFRAERVAKEIADIESIFDEFDIFLSSDWDIEARGSTLIKGGRQVHDFLNKTGDFSNKRIIANIPKLVKIVSLARLFNDRSVDTPVLDFIKDGYNDDDVWSIHQHLKNNNGYRGDLTALHFMMDIGFQVIKPDTIISRIFLNLGWLHKIIPELPKDLRDKDLQGKGKYGQKYIYTKEEIYKPIIDLARQIVSNTKKADLRTDIGWVTDNPLREFDIFIVKCGQEPDIEWGIKRRLCRIGSNPKEKCPNFF